MTVMTCIHDPPGLSDHDPNQDRPDPWLTWQGLGHVHSRVGGSRSGQDLPSLGPRRSLRWIMDLELSVLSFMLEF